jgi:hypothetical protein
MSLIDGVNRFFILYHDGSSMHFEGAKTVEEAAFNALRIGSYREPWAARVARFKELLDESVIDELHAEGEAELRNAEGREDG